MTELMWVRSHVERLLQDLWGVEHVCEDADGDYPFRHGSAACWVRIMPLEMPMVGVFAHAADGCKSSAKLLRELNEIQRRALSASLWLAGDLVVVSQTISAVGLTAPVLAQAIDAVGTVADDIGLLVASSFGGATPFPVAIDNPGRAPPQTDLTDRSRTQDRLHAPGGRE